MRIARNNKDFDCFSAEKVRKKRFFLFKYLVDKNKVVPLHRV